MDIKATNSKLRIAEVATRIREMRSVTGHSVAEMAALTGMDPAQYELYESGAEDLPFSFIYSCARAFNMELTELLEGNNATTPVFLQSRYASTTGLLIVHARKTVLATASAAYVSLITVNTVICRNA